MADNLTREQRKATMARVKSKDTKPEMVVRRAAHGLGYRYRLHHKQLPGKPDLVFPKYRKIIFVHGCFWHSHPGCKAATIPGSNREYWLPKLQRNRERDIVNQQSLVELGWQVLVIWECQTKNLETLNKMIEDFLEA